MCVRLLWANKRWLDSTKHFCCQLSSPPSAWLNMFFFLMKQFWNFLLSFIPSSTYLHLTYYGHTLKSYADVRELLRGTYNMDIPVVLLCCVATRYINIPFISLNQKKKTPMYINIFFVVVVQFHKTTGLLRSTHTRPLWHMHWAARPYLRHLTLQLLDLDCSALSPSSIWPHLDFSLQNL